jgi:8-oxo-dGTP pyrophosphatase MutT (NUDIX family)
VSRVVAALEYWRAPDLQQEVLRQEFLRHALTRIDADARTCLPDHITASALVVSEQRDFVLLGLHRKVGLWLQFGGHVETSDTTLADAALREAREESGLATMSLRNVMPTQLDRHAAPCSPDARHHLDVQYTAFVDGQPMPTVSDESLDVRWFPLDQIPDLTDTAVRRLIEASVTG